MTFADRVVVTNGGRIEQIGRPRAKRERSPNQSAALMVPRGGVPQAGNINTLRWQTTLTAHLERKSLFAAVATLSAASQASMGQANADLARRSRRLPALVA
jgi:ABC-type sugar transport system ATPase subunit